MTERCEDLDLFFDRELGAEAAQVFRDHLAACARCQDVLLGRMLEAAVVAPQRAPRPSPPVAARPTDATCAICGAGGDPATLDAAGTPSGTATTAGIAAGGETPAAAPTGSITSVIAVPRPGCDQSMRRTVRQTVRQTVRRIMLTGAFGVPAAAAVALVVTAMHPPPAPVAMDREPGAVVTRSLLDRRNVEVRFSSPALDGHRALNVQRAAAGPPPTERISLETLVELERHGQLDTLLGAHALNGDLASAGRTAQELPRTPQSLADRAALELLAADRSGAAQDAAAARALSLATEALRLDPALRQARWNQAIALRHLGLSLAAARVFDDLAASQDGGWSLEAHEHADQLRSAARRESDIWKAARDDADRMVLGGPVLTEAAVTRAPSLARDAFYQALATAATPARIDALVPLAHALDERFATTMLGDLLARVRASDLRARAPIAADLAAFIARRDPVPAIDALRTRALGRGARDIALASFLAVDERTTEDAHLALLAHLVADERDPWWKLIALDRRAFVAEFMHRDYPAVDAAERLAAPICKTVRSTWCGRITMFAGGANSQMGRADLALEQLGTARRQAREAAAWNEEVATLHGLGQAIENRVADDIDTAAVAAAYLEEVALRKGTCSTRLERLEKVAEAELQRHRFADAARLLADEDALRQGECRGDERRLIGETARMRLALRGLVSLDTVRHHLAVLGESQPSNRRLYLDLLAAGGNLVEDRGRGEAALRAVIDAATADPRQALAPEVRALAFHMLVESAAASGDAGAVVALLAERVRLPRVERCALGIASWNRLVVVAVDGAGRTRLETHEVPAGAIVIPPAEAVSPAMRHHLASCRRVDVIAPAPYFGAAKLLDDSVAWSYRTTAATPRGPAVEPAVEPAIAPAFDPARELVITDVTPPDELHLPALQSLSGPRGAVVLSGPAATPDNVLDQMKAASLVVVVAHGLTDASEPTAASLVLAPDPQGDYLLTASKVASARLTGSPIVILAGCDAGRVQVSTEPWSLATSFLQAGARVVIAPTEPIPDTSASDVFRSLIERIRSGSDPVDALVAERRSRGAAAGWLSSVVVFE